MFLHRRRFQQSNQLLALSFLLSVVGGPARKRRGRSDWNRTQVHGLKSVTYRREEGQFEIDFAAIAVLVTDGDPFCDALQGRSVSARAFCD